MKSRRYVCLILALSLIFGLIFSISASAAGPGGSMSDYITSYDGISGYTKYSVDNSTYIPFVEALSMDQPSEELYVLIVLDFESAVKSGKFFDLALRFDSLSYGSIDIEKAEFSSAGSSVITNISTVLYTGELYGDSISYNDLVFNHDVSSVTIKLKITDPSYTMATYYGYYFFVTSVVSSEIDEGTFSSRILRSLKSVWNSILNLPERIWHHFENGFKSLFIPTESNISALSDKFESLLDERFGAVYDSTQIVDDFANSFVSQSQSAMVDGEGADGTVSFPAVTVNLAGTDFTFGGYKVDLIPDKFSGLVDTLKMITNITCTLFFVNALKKRFTEVLS